jgi:hypothetical protein
MTEQVSASGARVQFMALVEQDVMTDLDTIRLVSQASRASVARQVIRPELERLKVTYAMQITRLDKLAKRAKATRAEYVSAYAKVFARSTYGVGLDALEEDDKAIREQILAARKESKKAA